MGNISKQLFVSSIETLINYIRMKAISPKSAKRDFIAHINLNQQAACFSELVKQVGDKLTTLVYQISHSLTEYSQALKACKSLKEVNNTIQYDDFVKIDFFMDQIYTIYARVLYETEGEGGDDRDSEEKTSKLTVDNETYKRIQNSLLDLNEELKSSLFQEFMLSVYEILDTLHQDKEKSEGLEHLKESLISMGLIYAAFFSLTNKVEKDKTKSKNKENRKDESTEVEFPTLARTVSKDMSHMVDIENFTLKKSHSSFGGENDFDLGQLFTNFSLKYATAITDLIIVDGTVREELLHLIEDYPWVINLRMKRQISK